MSLSVVDELGILALTFDVDGTLYDLKRQKLRVLPYAARYPRIMRRYSATVEGLRGERHEDLRNEICRRLGEEVGVTPVKVRQVVDNVVHDAWPKTFGPRTGYPGLKALMDAIDVRGVPRAVISDYDSQLKLDRMGVGTGWMSVISCERLGALKPLPDGITAACEAFNVEPNRILHIGDRADADEGMAQAAGAHSLILGRDFKRLKDLPRLLFGS
jgi:FMN phosphatase YigB (HAD superfamily)